MPRLSPSRRSQRRTAARGARALRHRAGLRLQCPRSAPLRAGGQPCPLGFRHGRATPHGLLCEQAWAKEALLILPGGEGGRGENEARACGGWSRPGHADGVYLSCWAPRENSTEYCGRGDCRAGFRARNPGACVRSRRECCPYIYIYIHVLFLSTYNFSRVEPSMAHGGRDPRILALGSEITPLVISGPDTTGGVFIK